MACAAYDLHFPLRLTTDHKPNRPDEHARIAGAGGAIDERHNRVVSEPKSHNGRVTLLSMSRCAHAARCLVSSVASAHRFAVVVTLLNAEGSATPGG
jgi:hypothetical protein